jgi:hypothetical protein
MMDGMGERGGQDGRMDRMGWEKAMGGGGGGLKDILSILCILSAGEEEDRMAGWTGWGGRGRWMTVAVVG